ncbi:MAG: proton-conducting transporter membrane subunit [Candidatus Bipolaricaulota bacterium]
MLLEHTPALTIGIPLMAAFLTPLLGKIHRKLRTSAVLLSVLLSLASASYLVWDVLQNGLSVYTLGASNPGLTLPSGYQVPVRIILQVDALNALMASLLSAMVLVGVIYSLAFVADRGGTSKYYALLLLLLAGMLGLVFTGDAFNMFVFLEVSSVAACGLIGFNLRRATSQEAAFKTLALYTVGALLFLFAVGILYGQYNALNFAYLANNLQYNFLDKVTLALFITALTMKVGAVPMHMWVPDAYGEAMGPVSLVLVSNTLASLYALYRICFTLFGQTLGSPVAGLLIVSLGTVTIFIGVTMAFLQDEIKRLMAYCALSQIGYMLLGVGVGLALLDTPALQEYGITALQGGLFHVVNDALYMGLLFLVGGTLIYVTGERKLSELSGLGRSMRWTPIFALIGIGAIAGLPPFNGFASKLMIYESVFRFNPILAVVALVASILTLAVLAKVFYSAFLGPQLPKFAEVNKTVPGSMIFAMAILSVLIIFIGLFPNLVVDNLIDPASQALLNQSEYVDAVVKMAGGSL